MAFNRLSIPKDPAAKSANFVTMKWNYALFLISLTLLFSLNSCNKETCDDGEQNQDETRVDCGGVCGACETCYDGILNNDETQIDCGGPNCVACEPRWVSIASPTSQELTAVDFFNETGIAVGKNGTIIKTTDGGRTWNSLSSGVSTHLTSVDVISESHFCVTGTGDVILVSEDGNSFSDYSFGLGLDWNDVHFISDQKGSICGGNVHVIYTENGGKNWTVKYQRLFTSNQLTCISFLDDEEGYAIGDQRQLQTLDGGLNWTDMTLSSDFVSFRNFTDLYYLRSNRAFMTKDEGLFFSTNSFDWYHKFLRTSNGKVDFLDDLGIYAGTHSETKHGKIMISKDLGVQWKEEKLPSPTSVTFGGISIVDNVHAIAVGTSGTILRRQY
ncbi:hypothetical protein KFE98_07945 [bacterium SCSIO 12741]|nr:hypothetical protein KFE98_07945 [bacterium SCSIO 12741]